MFELTVEQLLDSVSFIYPRVFQYSLDAEESPIGILMIFYISGYEESEDLGYQVQKLPPWFCYGWIAVQI